MNNSASSRKSSTATNRSRPEFDNALIKKYEDIMEAVDLSGKYQKIIFLTLATTVFSCCMLITTFPIQKELPDFFCVHKAEFQDSQDYLVYKQNNNYKVIYNEDCVAKRCRDWVIEREDTTNVKFQSAIFWVLVADYSSVKNYVTNLDLMCEVESYSGDFTRIIFLGRILATVILSYVSDKYGRLPVFKINLSLLIISNLGFLFSSNKFAYLIFGTCSNITMQTYNLSTIMSVEYMSSHLYSLFNGAISSLFAFCGLFSIGMMYFFQNWFLIITFHLILNLFVVYMTSIYMVETPRYCLMKRDYDTLDVALVKMSLMNGTYEDKVKSMIEDVKFFRGKDRENIDRIEAPGAKGENIPMLKNRNTGSTYRFNPLSIFSALLGPYLKIFSRSKDLENMVKLMIPFITVNFVYYGQLMFVEKLPGNVKINSFLIFFSELFSPNLAGYLLKSQSRRKIITVFHSLCILVCIIFPHVQNELIVSFLIFSNSFCICVNLVTTYVLSAEVFDTSIKSSANGLLILLANCPMVVGDLLMGIFPSPFYLFAILCGFSIFSVLKVAEKEIR